MLNGFGYGTTSLHSVYSMLIMGIATLSTRSSSFCNLLSRRKPTSRSVVRPTPAR